MTVLQSFLHVNTPKADHYVDETRDADATARRALPFTILDDSYETLCPKAQHLIFLDYVLLLSSNLL